jgi:hypothetical protein
VPAEKPFSGWKTANLIITRRRIMELFGLGVTKISPAAAAALDTTGADPELFFARHKDKS